MSRHNRPDPSARAAISWEGDSIDVLKTWPRDVQHDIGLSLRKLQEGERPTLATRPMQSIGQGVFELKAEDETAWYRVIYLARIQDTIYVLDSFVKNSRKTGRNDLNRARARLSKVRQRLQKEKIDAKGKRDK
jgi:phage-related protein